MGKGKKPWQCLKKGAGEMKPCLLSLRGCCWHEEGKRWNRGRVENEVAWRGPECAVHDEQGVDQSSRCGAKTEPVN